MKILVSLGDNTVATVIGQQFVSKETYQAELIGGLSSELDYEMYSCLQCRSGQQFCFKWSKPGAVPIAEVYVVIDRACCESARGLPRLGSTRRSLTRPGDRHDQQAMAPGMVMNMFSRRLQLQSLSRFKHWFTYIIPPTCYNCRLHHWSRNCQLTDSCFKCWRPNWKQ